VKLRIPRGIITKPLISRLSCWKQKMLIDVKKKKKRESRASKALYVQTAVKGRDRRGRDRRGRDHRGRDRPLPTCPENPTSPNISSICWCCCGQFFDESTHNLPQKLVDALSPQRVSLPRGGGVGGASSPVGLGTSPDFPACENVFCSSTWRKLLKCPDTVSKYGNLIRG
jgi:hypothetical protein